MGKKIKGSNGYIIAELTPEEEKRAKLGDEYFIGALGRIDESRISSYHCNICDKDFYNAPKVSFESINSEIGGVILIEEGNYLCNECNSVIAAYKRFGEKSSSRDESKEDKIPLKKFIGMQVFDDKARLMGSVSEISLSMNRLILSIKKDDKVDDLAWERVIAIRDIVLVKSLSYLCSSCNYMNKEGAKFCEQCGAQL